MHIDPFWSDIVESALCAQLSSPDAIGAGTLVGVFNKHIKKQIVCGKSIGFSNEFSCKHWMSDVNAPCRVHFLLSDIRKFRQSTFCERWAGTHTNTTHRPIQIQCSTSFRFCWSVRLCFVYNSQVLLFAVAWLKCVPKHTRRTHTHTPSPFQRFVSTRHMFFCGHSRCCSWWPPYSSDKACTMWLVK